MSDRFKLRKKRHGNSLPHQPSNRVNKFLSHVSKVQLLCSVMKLKIFTGFFSLGQVSTLFHNVINRRKPHLFNTLNVRGNMMTGGKRKPSFKMVSNMVIQLLHTIKFSMEVPFSNMTQQPVEMQKSLTTKKVNI